MKPIYIGLIVSARADDVFDQVNEDADWNLFDPAYTDGDDGTINDGVGYDYAQALHKNYKFFYAQMSGKLPGIVHRNFAKMIYTLNSFFLCQNILKNIKANIKRIGKHKTNKDKMNLVDFSILA